MNMESTDEYYILAFLKFGEREHMEDLLQNGTIYMNSLYYFRKHSKHTARHDKYEGISSLYNYPTGIIEDKARTIRVECQSVQISESYEKTLGNIYSLYCVSSYHIKDPFGFQIDKKNLAFGSFCIFVKDSLEFISRIKIALNKLGLPFNRGFVDYYNCKEMNGKVTLFDKPNSFEYQNEYRFYVYRESTEPLVLKIGNLKDIASLHPSEEVINTLKLTEKQKSA